VPAAGQAGARERSRFMFRPAFRLSLGILALSAILMATASPATAKGHRPGGPGTPSTWLAQLWCKLPITSGKNGCPVDPNGGQSNNGCSADPNGALGLPKAGCSADPNGAASPNKAGCHADPDGRCIQ
jgi:hypothetical protein